MPSSLGLWLRYAWAVWREGVRGRDYEVVLDQYRREDHLLRQAAARLRSGVNGGDMPTKYQVLTYGELEKGRPGEEVMTALGAVYVGRARCSRLRLVVIDLPQRGLLPVGVQSVMGSTGLAGHGLEGSLWEMTEQGMTRLDSYCGTGSGVAKPTMVRALYPATVMEIQPEEGVALTADYRTGGGLNVYAYTIGELLQGYLMWTNVTRTVVQSGSWLKFLDWLKRASDAAELELVVAQGAIGAQGFGEAQGREAEVAMTDSVLLRDLGSEAASGAETATATEIAF